MQIFFDYLSQRKKYISNKQNILSIKRNQDFKITYRRDHACIFRAFFVTSYRFYFIKLNFLRRRCRKLNIKLDMTLNGDVGPF